jgi:hypothetical protein
LESDQPADSPAGNDGLTFVLDPRTWPRDRREIALAATVLFIVVNLTFLPFLWGNSTLQESANHGAMSLYITGSRQPQTSRFVTYTVLDAGVGAWQMEPGFALAHDLIFREHVAPIWNPYLAYGAPFAANMISAPYSPLSWIPIIWSNARAYDWSVVLRLWVGGLFAFLFLRQFIGLLPALVGAAALMYTGYFWLYLTLHEVSVEVLIPALLYGAERLLRRPGLRTAAFFAVVLALSVFGGMPECTVLAALFAYLYIGARMLGDPAIRSNIRAQLSFLAVGTGVGVGLTAIQALPFLEFVANSQNFHMGTETAMIADTWSRGTLATYLAPLFQGPPWGYIFAPGFVMAHSGIRGFFGCAATFFALVATFGQLEDVIRRRVRDRAPTLLFAAIVALLVAKRFGLGFINWIGHLPILKEISVVHYDEAVIGCAVALLAGLGVARLLERRANGHIIWLAAVIPLAVLSAGIAADREAFLKLPSHREYYFFGLSSALVFLGIAGGGTLAFVQRRMTAGVFGALAFALVIA